MKVSTNATVYDSDDKRCIIHVKAGVKGLIGQSYLVLISGYDVATGAINWHFGMTDKHFNDYSDDDKARIIRRIFDYGGDCWGLRDQLNQTGEYLNE